MPHVSTAPWSGACYGLGELEEQLEVIVQTENG